MLLSAGTLYIFISSHDGHGTRTGVFPIHCLVVAPPASALYISPAHQLGSRRRQSPAGVSRLHDVAVPGRSAGDLQPVR